MTDDKWVPLYIKMEDSSPADNFSVPVHMLNTENIKVHKLKKTTSDKQCTEELRAQLTF